MRVNTKSKQENEVTVPSTPTTEEEKEQHLTQGQNFLNQLKQAKKRIEEAKPLPGDEDKVALLDKYIEQEWY
jgi:hypothetical protein